MGHSILAPLSLICITCFSCIARSAEINYETPAAAFRAAQQAGREGRPIDVMRCMTEDSIEAVGTLAAHSLIDFVQLVEENRVPSRKPEVLKESREQVARLLTDFGLPPQVIAELYAKFESREERLQQLSRRITDYPGLIIALAERGFYRADPTELRLTIEGELVATKIDGDRAQGTVIELRQNGDEMEKQFEFRRGKHGWRIVLPLPLESQLPPK